MRTASGPVPARYTPPFRPNPAAPPGSSAWTPRVTKTLSKESAFQHFLQLGHLWANDHPGLTLLKQMPLPQEERPPRMRGSQPGWFAFAPPLAQLLAILQTRSQC
ncbi:Hypothetical predicted protein [Marmota monax]|uniref:Uncharacterized protein n=1 Tax=Marmota monax TaxID=9995 RepID=A0A5E4CPQ1_MARMO|nr:hypothetical protein GHT09_009883 [Marmota monax]VTJ83139.1 Hypothetical predicted protein [Marmota monax]